MYATTGEKSYLLTDYRPSRKYKDAVSCIHRRMRETMIVASVALAVAVASATVTLFWYFVIRYQFPRR